MRVKQQIFLLFFRELLLTGILIERVHVRMWLRLDSLVSADRSEPSDLMLGRTVWNRFGKCYRETF